MPSITIISYIQDPNNGFRDHFIQYIQLCGGAIILALVIATPLGFLVARRPFLAFLANNISGIMRAIPSIVLLVAALPYLGIGLKPAIIALTVIGIPPILLNTTAAVSSIDPAIIDAAEGMGMNWWQILWRIELPLALPVVIAGIRTSAVQIIATGTLAAIIGVPGLGYYIFLGLNGGINSDTALLVGALAVAMLALVVEITLSFVQRVVTPVGIRIQQAEVPDVTYSNTSDAPKAAMSV